MIARAPGADAAGLAFEALEKAKSESTDVLLIDTAGRLQNKAGLMAELQKVARVLKKLDSAAPHAALLVLDATTGQNALSQVEAFQAAMPLTGLVMTKLDGTAKGGILVALADRFALPIHFHRRRRGHRATCRPSMPRRSQGRSQARRPPRQRVETIMTTPYVRTMSPLLKMALDSARCSFFLRPIQSRAFSPRPQCSWSRSRSSIAIGFAIERKDLADVVVDVRFGADFRGSNPMVVQREFHQDQADHSLLDVCRRARRRSRIQSSVHQIPARTDDAARRSGLARVDVAMVGVLLWRLRS